MNVSLISVRYAKALFGLALEKGILDEVHSDVRQILGQFKEVNQFQGILDSPVIKPVEKKSLFKSVYSNVINDVTMSFLLLLVDNQREALLRNVLIDFEDLYKEHHGIKVVRMITATTLEDAYAKKIEEHLSKELNSKIEFKTEVNSDLVGGFVIIVDGKMLDTSVLAKLKLLKKSLLA